MKHPLFEYSLRKHGYCDASSVITAIVAFLSLHFSCFASTEAPLLNVTVTTSMIRDLAEEIGGNRTQVLSLMGPGIDPHLYKATYSDMKALNGAELIFYNGLHLEGRMTEIFEALGKSKKVVAVSSRIPKEALRAPPEFAGNYDPHIWFDVSLWISAAETVRDTLKEIRPQYQAEFQERGDRLIQRFRKLDQWIHEVMNRIPKEQKLLITAHDAFGYFGRAYGIEVAALQGISTAGEYGVNDVERLVNLIITRHVPAIFVETSVPKRFIESVMEGAKAKSHEVTIGGTLFSDSMGAPGTPEGTYIGMVRANVLTIATALTNGKLPESYRKDVEAL